MSKRANKKLDELQFAKFSQLEETIVQRIVSRAVALYSDLGRSRDELDIRMDIAATHYHCPLQLEALFNADRTNFLHDIGGIERHLDRETGQLMNCFRPRFAQLA